MIQRIGKTLKRVFGGNDRFDALPIRGPSQVLQRPLMADADALNRNAPQNQWIDRCAQHVFLQNADHGYPAALSHRPKRLLETAPARQLQHMVGAAPIGKPAHRVGPIGRMAAKDTLPGPQCLDLFDFLVASRYDDCLGALRSEEHTSALQSLMRISYAVFCLKKKNNP